MFMHYPYWMVSKETTRREDLLCKAWESHALAGLAAEIARQTKEHAQRHPGGCNLNQRVFRD